MSWNPLDSNLIEKFRSQLLTPVEVIALFHEWDTDKSGHISRAEFHRAMRSLGHQASEAEVNALHEEVDQQWQALKREAAAAQERIMELEAAQQALCEASQARAEEGERERRALEASVAKTQFAADTQAQP